MEALAQKILNLKKGSVSPSLPSIRALVKEFQVGKWRISKALAELADQGLIVLKHKSRAQWVSNDSPFEKNDDSFSSLSTSDETIRLQIDAKISRGHFPIGNALPSLKELSRELGYSAPVIRRTLLSMVTFGSLIKKGRNYYPLNVTQAKTPSIPIVWVIQPNKNHWTDHGNNSLLGPFIRKFAEGAFNAGYRLEGTQCYFRKLIKTMNPMDLLNKELKRLPYDPEAVVLLGKQESWVDSFETVLNWIKRKDFLCIWFDYANVSLPSKWHFPGLIHCTFSETEVCKKAIQYLKVKKVRKAVYFGLEDQTWSPKRGALLEKLGGKIGLDIIRPAFSERFALQENNPLKLRQWYAKLQEQIQIFPPILQESYKQIQNNYSWIREYLKKHLLFPEFPKAKKEEVFISYLLFSVKKRSDASNKLFSQAQVVIFALELLPLLEAGSTIIVSNQKACNILLNWLQTLHLWPQKGIQVFTFDHDNTLLSGSVDTINWGYDELGAQAFHRIWTRASKKNHAKERIIATPRVIINGSI